MGPSEGGLTMTKKIMRCLCGLSFLYILGVAGNSDLGLEPSNAILFVKLSVGVTIFGLTAWLGGLLK